MESANYTLRTIRIETTGRVVASPDQGGRSFLKIDGNGQLVPIDLLPDPDQAVLVRGVVAGWPHGPVRIEGAELIGR